MSRLHLFMDTFIFLIVIIIGSSTGQIAFKCPSDWVSYGGYCYKFQADVPLSYDAARASCNVHGAGVVNVDNIAENSYLVQWLQRNDPFQQEWYTSGVWADGGAPSELPGYVWESTGQRIEGVLLELWVTQPDPLTPNGVIVFGYGQLGIGWYFKDGSVKRPYICKIPEPEAYRILRTSRGYDYGTDETDINMIEKGPHFVVQPKSFYVVSEIDQRTEPVSLECTVQANPEPVYRWFKGENLETEVTSQLDSRYSITNGKLTIESPNEQKDSNYYRCEAENKLGKVLSDKVQVAFGSLGEFNNVQDAGTRAKAYNGANIRCSNIPYKPAISYQWIKGTNLQFVRPQHQSYIFISNNGKLYFSEVTAVDEAEYTCVAILTGVNRYTIGTMQPPMRNSLPIPLVVDDEPARADWGPEIQNDFIAVFPKPALRGQDIRLECFAYGSEPNEFYYTWARDDKPMPATAETSDHNRVLVIRDAQLEDSGRYRCTVSRGTGTSDTKTLDLSLGSAPYFVGPLHDQHADIDSQLTWICNARGDPEPIYTWYKNGQRLSTDVTNRTRVQKNVLTLIKLDPKLHNGMYQCGAENSHGVSLSNAQLRVLAFAPSLTKHPPPPSLMAPQQGNITLMCQPEGAPSPTIEWLKGSTLLNSDGKKYTIYANGNLHITDLTSADRGVYTCRATNSYGTVEASTTLDTTESSTLTLPPADTKVKVNETTFLACQASYPRGVDMVYEWTFNGYPLDFTEAFYRQVQDSNTGSNGLYVIGTQFKHEGEYTCTARTPFNAVSDSAYLTVNGPPKQPAGVQAKEATEYTAQLLWTAGSNSGDPIILHIIQVSNEFEPEVWQDLISFPVSSTVSHVEPIKDKHTVMVEGLNPGTGYRFRVIAQNGYGRGEPSDPSTYIQTLSAPPAVSPRNLRGGGGSVGDLTIRWDPLHRSEYGAKSVGYRMYWRKKEDTLLDGKWREEVLNDPMSDHVVRLVGEENFYLLYEAKIQAFNNMGAGPNSTIAELYSAENLPIAVPEKVKTVSYNSTAIRVMWEEVPDTRQYVRGKLLGYQLNYWMLKDDPDVYMQFIRYYGQLSEALVIGLIIDNKRYLVDIQVFNSAGLGPRSNTYIHETTGYAPLHYPQEVHVSSAGRNRARVWWRGVSYRILEEGIVGYVIYIWPAHDDYRSARMIRSKGRQTVYTVKGIEDELLYAIRIAAYSKGGEGKKSPTQYFTMEGQILIDIGFAETIDVFLSTGDSARPDVIVQLLCSVWAVLALLHN